MVVEKEYRHFGPDGIGLQVAQREECAIYFAGSGGHVRATAGATEDPTAEGGVSHGGATDVEMQSAQWEKQVQVSWATFRGAVHSWMPA